MAGSPGVLERPVFAGGETKSFGELTLAEVSERATELASASGSVVPPGGSLLP